MTKTDHQKRIEKQIAHLAQKLAAQRSGGLSPVPERLRDEILRLWRESAQPMDPFGRRIGVTGASIANWVKAKNKIEKEHARQSVRPQVAKKKRGFKPIQVVPEVVPTRAKEGGVFELELASGARVRGLRMEDLAELIRVQGGAR